MDIMSLTAVELGKKIKAKEISVTEATQAYLDQIEKVENDVHSYVTIDKEGALKRAGEVQKMIDDGEEIEVNCHFCNKNHVFQIEELKELLKKAR